MASTFSKIFRVTGLSLFEPAAKRPLDRTVAQWQAPRQGDTRPAILILGTRGVPAAHGGFETFAERLALYLVDQGWKVTVYCQGERSRNPVAGSEAMIDEWRGIRRVSFFVDGNGPLSTMIFDWRAVLHARGERGLPLVLGYNTACFLPLLRLQGRAVLTNMDGIEWKRQKWPMPAKIWFFLNEWIGCMTSTSLIADHPEIDAHLRTRGVGRKITMIPYGAERIETADEAPLRRLGLVPDGYVVSIARIEPENSILEMVRAFSRRPRPFAMVCVGPFDPKANPYHREVEAAAGSQVIFPGPVYDKDGIQAIRRHALAYLHGHTVGGTNPSLVEALGAGNAVVAHRNRFNVWTAGSEQFYFSSEDECDAQFARLVEDPPAVARARRAATLRHEQAFTWPRILESYHHLCKRLVHSRVGVAAVLFLAGLLLVLQPGAARCEYILGPGDKLDVAVSGAVTRRATINADGKLAMPQLGDVPIAGLSLGAAQDRLRDLYRDKKILLNADVLIEVAEYRPFYISGDVARPGAYAFQPNITVRHAIALAGGLDMVRFRYGENPFIRAADLRNDYETLTLDNLRAQLRQRRLKAELDGKSDADFGTAVSYSVSPEIFDHLVRLERQQLRERVGIFEKETGSLRAAIAMAQQHVNTLAVEERSESDSVKQEQENLAQIGGNVTKGITPMNRLAETQRDLAAAKTRFLSTQSQSWSAKRSLEELQLQLDRAIESHRTSLLTEMQDASVTLEKIQSQVKAVGEKFTANGGARSALYLKPGNEVDVTIFRKAGDKTENIPASAESDVLAGDVIEIDLKPGRLLGMAAASPEADARR